MKYILVIGDGMADDPIPELGGKTPLQYANVPTSDKLASAGVLGCALTIPDGMQAGSDTAILSILGLDPRSCFSGRAPLEAAATGIKLAAGDIAYRCNMISIEDKSKEFGENKIISHSAGAIDADESNKLITDVFNTPAFNEIAISAGIKIYPGSSFRHIAVQSMQGDLDKGSLESRCSSSAGFSETKLTPPHDHIDESLGQHLPSGSSNAEILKTLIKLSHEILNKHPINEKRRSEGKLPANCIWFWAEGTAAELPGFNKRYAKTGSVISAVPLCTGIGVLIGLEKILVDGATGELNTNYEGKVEAAVESMSLKDFTLLHIEAPDECTHNGDLKGKIQAIEWIDSRILAPLLDKLNKKGIDFRILFMSDHRTLTSTRGHDSGAVPFILYDSRFNKETGISFTEEAAAGTGLTIQGTGLMDLLFEEK